VAADLVDATVGEVTTDLDLRWRVLVEELDQLGAEGFVLRAPLELHLLSG
jgi:hypothetical protein